VSLCAQTQQSTLSICRFRDIDEITEHTLILARAKPEDSSKSSKVPTRSLRSLG